MSKYYLCENKLVSCLSPLSPFLSKKKSKNLHKNYINVHCSFAINFHSTGIVIVFAVKTAGVVMFVGSGSTVTTGFRNFSDTR